MVVKRLGFGLDTRMSSKSCLSYDDSLLSYEFEVDFNLDSLF